MEVSMDVACAQPTTAGRQCALNEQLYIPRFRLPTTSKPRKRLPERKEMPITCRVHELSEFIDGGNEHFLNRCTYGA